jgi:tetratricopeptide (TPR) repeat protein
MRLPESRFTTKRRRGGVFIIIVVAMLVALVGAVAVFAVRARTPFLPIADAEGTEDIISLWNNGEYDQLIRVSSERLAEYPLDETALALRGFGRFYRGVQEVSEEDRQNLLLGAVQDLQRVLLIEDGTLRKEVHYVLGKAYFHRGRFFYDSAMKHLQAAEAAGMVQLDMLEYLALASESLGLVDEAIGYYREAIAFGDEAVHKVSLADLLIDIGEYPEANRLLSDARSDTSDVSTIRHALLSSGRAYREQGRYEESIASYEELIDMTPVSADAHYGLGETYYAMGDTNLARFEWREAVRLNPNHIESLQRLQDD